MLLAPGHGGWQGWGDTPVLRSLTGQLVKYDDESPPRTYPVPLRRDEGTPANGSQAPRDEPALPPEAEPCAGGPRGRRWARAAAQGLRGPPRPRGKGRERGARSPGGGAAKAGRAPSCRLSPNAQLARSSRPGFPEPLAAGPPPPWRRAEGRPPAPQTGRRAGPAGSNPASGGRRPRRGRTLGALHRALRLSPGFG